MKRYKHIWKTVLAGLTVVLATACTDELADSATGQLPLKPGDVALQLLPANMAIHNVSTRGTDPKTAAEQQINNIHVFIFDKTGEYLKASGYDAFQGYRYQEGNTTMVLNRTLFENIEQDPSDATVVVLANMPEETFKDENQDAIPDGINKLTDLENYVFNLSTFSATLPEGGLPMMVRKDGVNLAPDDETTTGSVRVETLQMESLMARIDLNFSLEPAQASGSKDYPSLRFDAVRVGNFPKGGRVAAQLNDATTKTSGVGLQEATAVEQLADFTGRYIREGQPQTLTLYMFEHGRAAKASTYPDGIKESEKQRYKNKLADETAAYIELEGIYTNHNNYKYKVTYRLYPGKDATADFTIKRNCQYKNNITVSGITVNGQGKEALLDTRVNIDTQANPYFIEMLREREHDAHFNVTPMDVYIYDGGSVTVKILNPTEDTWIRMEPMKSSPTAEGKIAAVNAGDGKRKYFTTDLVTQTLKDNTEYTVTYPTGSTDTHEERIYFYIDENVPQTGVTKDGDPVPAREATIEITYTRPEGEEGEPTHTREIPIRQAGMQAVYFNKFETGQWIHTCESYYIYIEDNEEYLAHYDGKNKYTDTYEGFKWGLNGVTSGLGVPDGYNYNLYMRWGWRNTMKIMTAYRQSSQWPGHEMTLNDTPSGAAEYCYNKNKRDSEGNVKEARWFLPTISELEYALEKFYVDYEVFQDKWYWSSNPGATGTSGNNGEDPAYARATRIYYNPNDKEANEAEYVHYQSSPDWIIDYPNSEKPWAQGLGGHSPREKELRIRAAYIYQIPKDGPAVIE